MTAIFICQSFCAAAAAVAATISIMDLCVGICLDDFPFRFMFTFGEWMDFVKNI